LKLLLFKEKSKLKNKYNCNIFLSHSMLTFSIHSYETCMRLLKELPPSFPPDKLEFLDKIKAKLEQGEYIGKDYFLKTIEKLDPDSAYWKQQEPLIIIFKNDNHINVTPWKLSFSK